jgi:hypothetical protein
MITWQQFNEQALDNHMEEVASRVCKTQRVEVEAARKLRWHL